MNYLAAGVNAPLPLPGAFPQRITASAGPYLFDAAGRPYIDCWMGYGALLFGHQDRRILEVAREAVAAPWYYGSPSDAELHLAERIHKEVPSAERMRFAATGAEALMYAARISRAATGRIDILCARGGYHGAIETPAMLGGVPAAQVIHTVPFNDAGAFASALASRRFAACILEPVMGNNGCVPPKPGFLEAVRSACAEHGTIFILDEVMTGFRLHRGGAQAIYGVTPDLVTFSKAIAGGFPLSVVAGRTDLLDQLIPSGGVFFAGTFYGHPASLAVALHVQERLADGNLHRRLAVAGDHLRSHIATVAQDCGLSLAVQGIGSMWSVAFTTDFPAGVSEAVHDESAYHRLITHLAEEGLLMPPLAGECAFLSDAHVPILPEIEATFVRALQRM